ncbi:hypothetical protein [Archaeoglobus veneficus]|uniref:Uncharacterized protein n=1 Tax=Archaeoglobus veneficus (strain DSM 11195 / SNP6) TaxID=693661 RepID=F2KME8_ARCVS|nr:hypothetical protein [Archaeoglobus veneficus]AEA46047.1 hypothetical protein Arcve_0003 [Archaeoglobus veneficus SNP6]
MPKEVKIKVPTPDEVVPEEFKKHMLNAYRELLLAFKSLVDEHVKKVEEMQKRSEGKKEIQKIEIE